MSAGGSVRRVAEAVEGSIGSAATLPEFQRELLEHIRSMDAGIQEMNASMTRVEALIVHIDEQIPGPDAPSPLEKAKDALLGADSGDQKRTEE